MKSMGSYILLLFIMMISGCFTPNLQDGKVSCSNDAKRPCPSGYYCFESKCYHDGHVPFAAVKAHSGTAVLAGATSAQSAHYRVQMSTSGSPVESSLNYRRRGGVVGATGAR